MVRWASLFILAIFCLLVGLVAGVQINRSGSITATAPPTPTLTPSLASTPDFTKSKFVLALVNDLALKTESRLQMMWFGTLDATGGPIQIALAPPTENMLHTAQTFSWVDASGTLNHAALEQFLGAAAPQFHFILLDMEAITSLLQSAGAVPLPGAKESCQAEACLGWVYEPGLDQTAFHQRWHELALGVLAWAAAQPQERALLLQQWLVIQQGRGKIETDIPPEVWSRWAEQASQQGVLVIP